MSQSPIDVVTQHLEGHKLKRVGPGRWVSCCPHHEDRSPSLSIAEGRDGRVLLHCHAGCSVDQVVGSLGLDLQALFPDDGQHTRSHRRPVVSHRQVLEMLKGEVGLVGVAARNLANGHQLTAEDLARLKLAEQRITIGMQTVGL